MPVLSKTVAPKRCFSRLAAAAAPVPFCKSGQTLMFVAIVSWHQAWLIEQFSNDCRKSNKLGNCRITWLRLLRLVIGLKDSRQFFNQWEVKPIAPCTRDFFLASGELQVIARNCDWSKWLLWFWFFNSHLKTALYKRLMHYCKTPWRSLR